MPALLRAWEPWLPWRAAVRNALAMETLYVEGQALGLTLDQLARLEAVAAQRARYSDRPLLVTMRSEVYVYAGYGVPPAAPVLITEHVAVVAALMRRLGRLVLLGVFERMGGRA